MIKGLPFIQASMPPNSGARSPTSPPTFRLALTVADLVATPAVGAAAVSWVGAVVAELVGWPVVSVVSTESEPPQAATKKTSPRSAAIKTGSLVLEPKVSWFNDVLSISIQRPRSRGSRRPAGTDTGTGLICESMIFTARERFWI